MKHKEEKGKAKSKHTGKATPLEQDIKPILRKHSTAKRNKEKQQIGQVKMGKKRIKNQIKQRIPKKRSEQQFPSKKDVDPQMQERNRKRMLFDYCKSRWIMDDFCFLAHAVWVWLARVERFVAD